MNPPGVPELCERILAATCNEAHARVPVYPAHIPTVACVHMQGAGILLAGMLACNDAHARVPVYPAHIPIVACAHT